MTLSSGCALIGLFAFKINNGAHVTPQIILKYSQIHAENHF